MAPFIGDAAYDHAAKENIGVLLVNLGTPEAATPTAVRRYLRQFLSDPRVVETPRWLWWLILNLIVLPFRPRKTAAAYQKIWKDGSPLLHLSRRQQQALQQALAAAPVRVALGMSYGEPSIAAALNQLKRQQCRRLLVLPLYPQYAGSTTGSVFEAVTAALRQQRLVPHFRFISGYCDDPRYIAALADSIAANGGDGKLIFSFHGTPLNMLLAGDPYHCLCHKTARLTAEKLGLAAGDWMVTFQSRFGRAEWLRPYTDETLRMLPQRGVKNVRVVCPAFAADCLETLEEIAQENRDIFMDAGGDHYRYIPALNDTPSHISFLRELILETVSDWLTAMQRENKERPLQATLAAAQKARIIKPPAA